MENQRLFRNLVLICLFLQNSSNVNEVHEQGKGLYESQILLDKKNYAYKFLLIESTQQKEFGCALIIFQKIYIPQLFASLLRIILLNFCLMEQQYLAAMMRVNPQRQFLSHKCLPLPSPPTHRDSTLDIGDYRLFLDQCLGKGSFSKVYAAVNTITKQKVAIKSIRSRDIQDSLTKDLLRTQMATLKQVKHPHVLCCLDIFITEQATYIVTEYCEEDLGKRVGKGGRIDTNTVWKYFTEVVKGYGYLRGLGIVHRDLKPNNILLRNNTAKIADFGFAKIVPAGQFVKEKYNVGSPLYMPPEALRDNIYSQKSDIWSLGVILYQLLTGRAPFKASDQKSLPGQILKTNISALISETTPRQFHQILKGCLTVQVPRRFDLSQLISALGIDIHQLDYSNTPIIDYNLEYYKLIDKVLVNELNYVEFLRRFVKMAQNKGGVLGEKVRYIARKNMTTRVRRLEGVGRRENVYNLVAWDQYVRKTNFKTFLPALSRISEYTKEPLTVPVCPFDRRFESTTQIAEGKSEKLLLNYQFYLRKMIQSLKEELLDMRAEGKFETLNEVFVLLDFAVCAYQLNGLCIDYFSDPVRFADQSCLGIIVNSDMRLDDSNFGNLLKKMQTLQL